MSKSSRPKKRVYGLPKLEMTPMIDVVFLLLIFFIVTLQPQDILATLDISEKNGEPEPQEIPPTLEIMVRPQSYVVGSVRMTLPTIDKKVERLCRFSKNTTMKIYAHPDSEHARLVRLLDLCEKHDLNNVVLMKQSGGSR